jgi:hypothetical protein
MQSDCRTCRRWPPCSSSSEPRHNSRSASDPAPPLPTLGAAALAGGAASRHPYDSGTKMASTAPRQAHSGLRIRAASHLAALHAKNT